MRSSGARGLVILGGLALAAILAGPMPAAAGNVSAIAGGVPAIVNPALPALPAPPRVPPALVGPDPIYQRGSLGQDRPRDRRPHGQRPGTTVVVVTQPIYVSPGRCWYPGHWTYEWVPQWTAYNAWVDQQVSPEGEWVGGYYESRWYPSGSYQPYWVEGYYDGC
jgi:hypothetical protein